MNVNRKLIANARNARVPLALGVLFAVASTVFLILQASAFSSILNQVFLQHTPFPTVQRSFLPLILYILLRSATHYLGDHYVITTARIVKADLRARLLGTLHGPASAGGIQHSGEVSNDTLDGIEALDGYFSQYLPQLVLGALLPLLILLFVLPLDGLTALVMILTAPLIPLFMILIGKTAEETTRVQWAQMRRMSVHFLDTLQGLTVLKALNQIKAQLDRMADVSERYRLATLQVLRVTFLSSLVLEMVGTLSTAIIAVQIGVRLLSGGIDFETAFFILVIAPDFYQPIRQLGLRFHTGMNAIAVWERVSRWLPLAEKEPDVIAEPTVHGSKVVPGAGFQFASLALDSVSYRYPDRTEDALHSIDLRVIRGQRVALVGPSGSGKTTALHLLLGLLKPDAGRLLLNGVPADQDTLVRWRQSISWVPQRPHLFMGTLRENIALASPLAAERDIIAASEFAGLGRLIDRLPAGLDTNIGERGARLSGGEAQRVALARAFLQDGQVLIMDEPTAHLDLQLEADLTRSVQQLSADKTVITIAHRLQTVIHSDMIYVFDDGRIHQSGSHKQLVDQPGLYRQLVAAGQTA